MIELQHVSAGYGAQDVVRDVSFAAPNGQLQKDYQDLNVSYIRQRLCEHDQPSPNFLVQKL